MGKKQSTDLKFQMYSGLMLKACNFSKYGLFMTLQNSAVPGDSAECLHCHSEIVSLWASWKERLNYSLLSETQSNMWEDLKWNRSESSDLSPPRRTTSQAAPRSHNTPRIKKNGTIKAFKFKRLREKTGRRNQCGNGNLQILTAGKPVMTLMNNSWQLILWSLWTLDTNTQDVRWLYINQSRAEKRHFTPLLLFIEWPPKISGSFTCQLEVNMGSGPRKQLKAERSQVDISELIKPDQIIQLIVLYFIPKWKQ